MALPTVGDIQFQDLLNEFCGGRSEVTATIDSGANGVTLSSGLYYLKLSNDKANFDKIYPGMRVDEGDPWFGGMTVSHWQATTNIVTGGTIILEGIPNASWNTRFGKATSAAYSIKFIAKKASQFTRKAVSTSGLVRNYGLIPDLPDNVNVPSQDDVHDTQDIKFSDFRGTSFGSTYTYIGKSIYTGEVDNYTAYFDSVPNNNTWYTRLMFEANHESFTVPATLADWRINATGGRYRLGGRYRRDKGLYDTDYYYTYMKNAGWVLIDDATNTVVYSSLAPEQQQGADALTVQPPDKTDLAVEAGKTYRIAYQADMYAHPSVTSGFIFETYSRPVFTLRSSARG